MTVPTRKEDVPLHDDVRWLAGALGRVIQRLEGKEAFEIVEVADQRFGFEGRELGEGEGEVRGDPPVRS